MNPAGPTIHFLNVAYFFNFIYTFLYDIVNGVTPSSGTDLTSLATSIWLFITIISYIISLIFLGILIYCSLRLFQAAEEDAKRYTTISKEDADVALEHSRWSYIKSLIESTQQSDWRQAIIEADIMLDELLTNLGYHGAGVGDKLKVARDTRGENYFRTLDEAWEAHLVRNEVAHRGSESELSDHLAYRTIGHYENVFREFNEI